MHTAYVGIPDFFCSLIGLMHFIIGILRNVSWTLWVVVSNLVLILRTV